MQASIKSRVYKDIEKRSQNGAYIYTGAWLAIGLGTGFYEKAPFYFYTFLLIFAFLGMFRIAFYFTSRSLNKNTNKMWTGILQFNALAPAIVMSILFTLSMLNPLFEPTYFYLLLAMFAMLSGGVVNFSPHPKLSLFYLIALILPTFTGALLFSTEHYIESSMLVLYGLFMYALSRRLSKEYLQLVSQQQELERLNNEDSLTGIANRRSFDNRFALNWASHSRSHLPLSLIILDIDHFKKINDSLGHAAGDEVIKSVAKLIKNKFKRSSDCVARIGGEEYGVLVPLTDFDKVFEMADELRLTIQKSPINWEGSDIQITVSVGVASCQPSLAIEALEMFKVADKCLYSAKSQGRNNTIREKIEGPLLVEQSA